MNEMTDSAAGIVAEVASPVKKTCSKCGAEKVLEEYPLQKAGKFGRHCWCKVCFGEWRQTYKQRPGVKRQQRAYARAYRKQPKFKEWWRAYRQRPEVKEKLRAYAQRPESKKWKRAYLDDYEQRPEVRERKRAYQQRPESKKWRRIYEQRRSQTDHAFKLVRNLRVRLRHALKSTRKSARTLELLGCTVEELRAHLEAQFEPGMTWENQGYRGWHIDHIRPCASFDMSDPEQQRACFHYTNLQPLWAKENMSKGAKFSLTPPRSPE